MSEFGFIVHNVLSHEEVVVGKQNYEKKYGIKLNKGRSNTWESSKVTKKETCTLPMYCLEYKCMYAGQNKNPENFRYVIFCL